MDRFIGVKLQGRYEIKELVGFGGMAVVYKAFDIDAEKFVAVKILKDEFMANDDFKRRFRNESKAISMLSHPAIVKVFDVEFNDSIQYIVMEYIDGITLKEYVEQQGKVNWKETLHFATQTLRALQHAHDNGIVHRDIKPQNVMLLEDGTIKVMDFGIARFARENARTVSDKAIGSVHYISPEQAKGDETDERTDVYAVGVMMYEMLTGAVPFDGDAAVMIALKQMQEEPKKLTDIDPDIPIGLEEITLRAMQKDPEMRHQMASEMLKDIYDFKENPSIQFEYKYIKSDEKTRYFTKVGGGEGEVPKVKRKRSYTMNILAGITLACVIVTLCSIYFLYQSVTQHTGEVVIVDIVGVDMSQAQQKMPYININQVEFEMSDTYEKGIIISQNPGAGEKVKENSTVNVVVSSGLADVTVPQLYNQTSSEANEELEGLGLNVTLVQKVDNKVAFGYVVGTEPASGEKVARGSDITVFVSRGKDETPIEVPDLEGMTEVEARIALTKLGLGISTVTTIEDEAPSGQIVTQNPEAGSKILYGDLIEVEISSGQAVDKAYGDIAIVMPNGESSTTTFDVYVNRKFVRSVTMTPKEGSILNISFNVSNGYIDGDVKEEIINEIEIFVGDVLFVSYLADFQSSLIVPRNTPNFALVYPYGYEFPSQDEEIKDAADLNGAN